MLVNEFRKIFSVTALIIDKKNRLVLAVSRKDNPNDFGLPGGKVEPGETPERAIRRELSEETGLTALSLKPVYDRTDAPGGNKFCRCFLIEAYYGQVASKEDGVVKWITYDEIKGGTFGYYNTGLLQERSDLFR